MITAIKAYLSNPSKASNIIANSNDLNICVDRLASFGIKSIASESVGYPTVRHARNVFDIAVRRFAAKRVLTSIEPPILMKAKKDIIFHNPFPFPIIMKGVKNILTVHDAIPLSHPELCLSDPGYEFDLLNQLIESSDAIHAISDFAASELIRLFNSKVERKIHVVNQATPSINSNKIRTEQGWERIVRERSNLYRHFLETSEGYLLQVGTIEPKKIMR